MSRPLDRRLRLPRPARRRASGGSERDGSVFGTARERARARRPARTAGSSPLIADVLDPDSLARLPAADRVFYCVGFDRSAGVPMRTVYVDGLRNALEALAGRTRPLVYASSTGVYGRNDGDWVDEDSPTEPAHRVGPRLPRRRDAAPRPAAPRLSWSGSSSASRASTVPAGSFAGPLSSEASRSSATRTSTST